MTELFRIDDDQLVLRGGRSPSSGLYHFPLSDVCPYTGADDVEPVDLPTSGRLWLWTAVTSSPPGYAGPVPYGFADPANLEHGRPMRLVVDEFDGVTTWAFTPA